MKVGIPSEISPNELRVAATPKTVKRLQKQGFEVYIQSGAGTKANFSDKDFEEAGAKIIATAADIYGKSDIVLKVKEPSMEEVDLTTGTATVGSSESSIYRFPGKGTSEYTAKIKIDYSTNNTTFGPSDFVIINI